MYSSLGNIQVLVSLLKKYGIKHVVISAGTRHTPLVYSLEHDDYFKTYSVVDERSASFFALGIIEETKSPAAVCCTSGTAAANYVSAANEAFYQQLPLLILTADRNHYYKFQQEEQMIPQEHLYSDVCKKVVTLPHVRDEKDFWYASRICNEALLELTTGEKAPVHINFIVENDYPIHQGIVKFEQENLPEIRKIDRLSLEDCEEKWADYAQKFKNSKILIIYGQNSPLNNDEIKAVEEFASKYNCVISVDILSNLHCKYTLPTYNIGKVLDFAALQDLCPDIVITMNANSITPVKNEISALKDKFRHIHVSAKGEVSDPFKCLPDVIACSPVTFFKKFAKLGAEELSEHSYYEKWHNRYVQIGENGILNNENIEYSSLYVTQQLINSIPKNSLFHIANSMSIRYCGYFEPTEGVSVYCNRGTCGIDGSMSSFIGQAQISGKPSYLLIGDLSFFYDMNALWNQYLGSNLHIVVLNNSGGAIFYNYPGEKNMPTVGQHIAAVHETSIKAWAQARGFKYFAVSNKEETSAAFNEFANADSPVIIEAFTNKNDDIKAFNSIIMPYKAKTFKQKIWANIPEGALKDTVRAIVRKGK